MLVFALGLRGSRRQTVGDATQIWRREYFDGNTVISSINIEKYADIDMKKSGHLNLWYIRKSAKEPNLICTLPASEVARMVLLGRIPYHYEVTQYSDHWESVTGVPELVPDSLLEPLPPWAPNDFSRPGKKVSI